MGNINKMVSKFNENNQKVKALTANKNHKVSEKEMNTMVEISKDLSEQCLKIEGKLKEAYNLANQIEDRLHQLKDVQIPVLKEKYSGKNQKVDECDEVFGNLTAALTSQDKKIVDKLDKVDDLFKKLKLASPLHHPSSRHKDNSLLV